MDWYDEDNDNLVARWVPIDEEKVVWDNRLTSRKFTRPQHGIVGLFTRYLPAYSDNNTDRNEIDFYAWFWVKQYINPRHCLGAVLMLVAILVSLPVIYRVPLMDISVVKLGISLFRVVRGEEWGAAFSWPHYTLSDYLTLGFGLPLWLRPFGLALIIWVARVFYSTLPQRVMWEEQVFREGSERWSKAQIAKSCVLFGLAHVTNLIYPVGVILLLIVGGYIFTWFYMWQYKKSSDATQATIEAATLHLVYNTIALGFAVFYLGINVLF